MSSTDCTTKSPVLDTNNNNNNNNNNDNNNNNNYYYYYCTKPSKFKGISCAINAIQCYNFRKECYNY